MRICFNRALVCLLVAVCSIADCKGQHLQQGDTIPDLQFQSVINYNSSTLRLSDFKDRFIVFDFWGRNCVACIQAFPKIDSLQKKYKDRLQFILVTSDSKGMITEFFSKRKKIVKPDVVMICSDSLLFHYIPRSIRPYYVFADGDRVLRYVSEGRHMNAKNIQAVLDKQPKAIPHLKEIENNYNSLVTSSLTNDMEIVSAISHYNRAYQPGSKNKLPEGKHIVVSAMNRTIAELFTKAYTTRDDVITRARLLFEVEDSNLYVRPATTDPGYDAWQGLYSYSYELRLPRERAGEAYAYMQEDLRRFFRLEIKKENRIRACLVLYKTGDDHLLLSKGQNPLNKLYDGNMVQPNTDSLRYIQNLSFTVFSKNLKNRIESQLPFPFVDATNFSSNADLFIPAVILETLDIDKLNEVFRKYGLVLKREMRNTDVFVLTAIN